MRKRTPKIERIKNKRKSQRRTTGAQRRTDPLANLLGVSSRGGNRF